MSIIILLLSMTIAITGAMVCYLLVLTIAACLASRRTPTSEQAPSHRFVVMIPAHNEERLLPELLNSLKRLDYPADLYSVHVVADNCTDQTAALARRMGTHVYERNDLDRRGKPYALRWLFDRMWESGEPYDAVLILDADSVVSENFLAVMDARLARGERAIQAYYGVRQPERSWSASMRAIALSAIHYVRPMGRMLLGGSAGLKGNGVVFTADITRRYHWPVSLTEDVEYHMTLLLGGERVTFAPDAIVLAEMPGTLADSRTQNVRWERGRLQVLRQYVPLLLSKALKQRSFLLLDAAIEQMIPPFSVIVAITLLCLLAGLIVSSYQLIVLSVLVLVGEAAYVLAGPLVTRSSYRLYLTLLYAPAFLVWKLWLYVRVVVGLDRQGWVRTARNK